MLIGIITLTAVASIILYNYDAIVLFIINNAIPNSIISNDISEIAEHYGQVGSFIGGVWGITISTAAFIVAIFTWHSSKKIDAHSKRYQVFAEILRTHEEIVSSINMGSNTGRDAIAKILSEFDAIYKIIISLEKAKEEEANKNKTVYVKTNLTHRIGVAFSFMYYGAHEDAVTNIAKHYISVAPKPILAEIDAGKKDTLKNEINREYDSQNAAHQYTESIDECIDKISSCNLQNNHKELIIDSLNKFSKISRNPFSPGKVVQLIQKYTKPAALDKLHKYPGHQKRLSHYFRNLRSALDYIKYEEFSKSEKKVLTRILVSKLSNHEQALIALYVLTKDGHEWMSNKIIDELMPIRNIPEDFFKFDTEFILPNMFPNVNFDWANQKNKNPVLAFVENLFTRIS